jgi:hypothetical protein
MNDQIKIVGWLHVIWNGIHLLGGLAVFLFFAVIGGAVAATGDHDAKIAVPILGSLGAVFFLIIAGASVPGFLAGLGVLNHANWGRVLCIVVSIFELFYPPFGTALGVYSLVVLTNSETVMLFDRRRY